MDVSKEYRRRFAKRSEDNNLSKLFTVSVFQIHKFCTDDQDLYSE